MGQLHPRRVARRVVEVQVEILAFFKDERPVGEHAHAQLGALQIGEDADRTSQFFLDLANQLVARGGVGVRAVAHVQAEHVRTGLDQRLDGLFR